MTNKDDPVRNSNNLRGTISILTRGGPFTVNTYQHTNPVLLQDMELPAKACYEFPNPIDTRHNYVNSPISIELFFGENGSEKDDISLGKFKPEKVLPVITEQRKIELELSVSLDQILGMACLDHTSEEYRQIGFIESLSVKS